MVPVVLRRPCLPQLRPWVSAVWWCPGTEAAESVLPAGRAHLVLPVDGGWRAGVLHGPASRLRRAGPVPGEPVIGVVFRPGGSRLLFDAPADSLADLSVALPELWSRGQCGLPGRLGGRRAGRLAGGPGEAGEAAGLLDSFERALAA